MLFALPDGAIRGLIGLEFFSEVVTFVHDTNEVDKSCSDDHPCVLMLVSAMTVDPAGRGVQLVVAHRRM